MRLIPLRTVLVATDVAQPATAALVTGQRFAHSAGATLHVLHVSPGSGAMAGSERLTGALHAAVRDAGVSIDRSCLHVLSGDAPDVIDAFATRLGADVVVLGPHRRSARTDGAAFGSTAHALASRAAIPCLVVARPLHLPLRRVLVPTDLSPTARGALIVALSWASALRGGDTSLTAFHVRRASDASPGDAAREATLDSELAVAHDHGGGWAGVAMEGRTTTSDDAARAIVEAAVESDADLVVLGTRGLGLDGAARMGSVSASVSATTELPLLLVPPAVWKAYAAESA